MEGVPALHRAIAVDRRYVVGMMLADLQVSVDRDALDWITLGISSVLAILALLGFWSSNMKYRVERADRLAERRRPRHQARCTRTARGCLTA